MTLPSSELEPPATAQSDYPQRKGRVSEEKIVEMVGSGLAAVSVVWVGFTIVGISAWFGTFFCSYALFLVFYGVVLWRRHGVLHMKDGLATVAVWSGAALALVALLAVVAYVIVKGAPVVFSGFPGFIVHDMTGGKNLKTFGVGPAIVGTIEQVAIATVISIPIAYMTATYLVESRSVLARVVRNVIDAMTGTPSIIAGLFIYSIWVIPHGRNGQSGFVAAVTLSIMMLPVTCRAALEVIRIVPGSLREAALALGAPQWRVVLRVVLPTAKVGLVTAAILGIARTAGETAEVLFTAGGNTHYNFNPFSGRQDDLPLRVYEQVFQPNARAISIGWGAAFVLVVVVLGLFVVARLVGSSGMKFPTPRLRRRTSGDVP